MRTRLSFAFVCLLCFIFAVPALATTYNVGPGQTYTNIRDVPWESIAAGDTVNIYYRATPYKEKFNVTVDATVSQPFVVHGVPGPGGELPVIDGQDAVTRTQHTYPSDERAVINVGRANNKPSGFVTTYVTFENLEVIHARSPFSYTSDDGTLVNFGDGANGFYMAATEHAVIRNCVLHDNGEGFFFSSSDGYGTTKYMVAEGSYVYANGSVNSGMIHNSYCESMGITYQYNYYGKLISGSIGNNLKDRSSNMVIRYNWIDSGDRLMDLVDAEDSLAIRSDPNYNKAFVYGNILLKNTCTGQTPKVLHFGYDGKSSYSRVGPLQFYNNTVVSYLTGPTYLLRGSKSAVTTDCYNNILFVTDAGSNLNISYNAGTVNLSHNFLKPGWVNGPGVVNDDGTQVTGSDPGFANFGNQDFHLAAGSPCINAGKALPGIVLPDNDVVSQYVKHQQIEPRPSDGTLDIGAFEGAGGPPPDLVITTTSLPNGNVGSAYSATIQATGGVAPYTWSVFSGSLPAGLSLNPSTGVISGTPTTAGTSYFTAQVVDSQDPADSDTQALSIIINASAPLTITTTSLPNARRNRNYSQTLQATGGVTPYTWSIVSGSLPPGLTLNSSTGVISGKATTLGTYPFTARVTDSQAPPATDDQALSITVTS